MGGKEGGTETVAVVDRSAEDFFEVAFTGDGRLRLGEGAGMGLGEDWRKVAGELWFVTKRGW